MADQFSIRLEDCLSRTLMSISFPLFDQVFDGSPEPTGPPLSGQDLKESGIAEVQRNANPEWLEAFRLALERVARSQRRFTSDAIWEEFEKGDTPYQHEPRAAGAVVVKAIKDGVIVPVTSLFWKSNRPLCHHRPKQVYQSLIYTQR